MIDNRPRRLIVVGRSCLLGLAYIGNRLLYKKVASTIDCSGAVSGVRSAGTHGRRRF